MFFPNFDLPSVNTEAAAMIKSYISTKSFVQMVERRASRNVNVQYQNHSDTTVNVADNTSIMSLTILLLMPLITLLSFLVNSENTPVNVANSYTIHVAEKATLFKR